MKKVVELPEVVSNNLYSEKRLYKWKAQVTSVR